MTKKLRICDIDKIDIVTKVSPVMDIDDIQCRICGKVEPSMGELRKHILRTHKLEYKIYYDTFVKDKWEGICYRCGNPTPFEYHCYAPFCGIECSNARDRENILLNRFTNKSIESQYDFNQNRDKRFRSLLKLINTLDIEDCYKLHFRQDIKLIKKRGK